MATILQFAERLADGQDWTVSERAQLRDVGAQLDGVDVVFGKSEAGDPWCVVTDDSGEVLLHVARIDGDFVIHATHEDEIVQDEDLWSAAKRLLGDMLKERRGVLLAFPPEALGQTAVLAFLFAAAMRGEFDHWLPSSVSDAPPPAEPRGTTAQIPGSHTSEAQAAREAAATEAAGAPDPDAPDRGEVTREALRADAREAQTPAASHDAPMRGQGQAHAPAAAEAPAPTGAAPNTPTTAAQAGPATNRTEATGSQTGTASFSSGGGGDAGAGSTGGGDASAGGNDGVKTAGEPSNPQAPLTEFVEGGAGDDRIAMAGNIAATGGGGADTFVLTLPNASRGAPVLLGLVADFRAGEGDRLELTGKGVVVVDRAESDLLASVRTRLASGSASAAGDTPVMSGRHIGYDIDGDGQEDAYVLVTGGGVGWFAALRQAGGVVGDGAAMSGAATNIQGGEAVHAPISITAEAPHPPPGAEFLF